MEISTHKNLAAMLISRFPTAGTQARIEPGEVAALVYAVRDNVGRLGAMAWLLRCAGAAA